MQFSVLSILAGASLAAAAYAPVGEDTTTLTSTTTRVITLTACPDSVVDCPYRTTTTTEVAVITSTSAYVVSTPTYVPPVVNTTISTTSSSSSIYTPPAPPKSTYYPAGNTTTHHAGPTAPVVTYTSHGGSVPTTLVPGSSVVYTVPAAGTSAAPSEVPSTVTGAASALVAKSGVVGAIVVAALVALY
ncbi:hypothetical protein B0T10DRAFT_322494 [Thelonectria olida]|jgi:hypothetical protein|uniref:Uncharacterized protein n=1 Tax=Thelonectria olida TaxID=1576542 RepID=A0A9P8W596_9HYPO|nr:hypothetical protein B0T10DRAFT_322494 [Thelonectria olida]